MAERTERITDQAEREAALDPARSFIVQAPAGSGKTELLMQRFLSLLATVEDPGEILAITFTRKAAGEMSCRVLDALRRAASGGWTPSGDHEKRTLGLAVAVLERDGRLGWNLLENPSRLRVMTIDSLCSSLASRLPLLSRLASGPRVAENPAELYEEAARRVVAMVEARGGTGGAARTLLDHMDNSVEDFTARIVAMLERRDQWLRHVSRDLGPDEFREYLERSLRNVIEDELAGARAAFPPWLADGLIPSARYAAANLAGAGAAGPVTALADLDRLPAAVAEDLDLWRGVAALLVTNGGEWRKPGGVNVRIGFPTGGGEAKEKKEAFKDLLAAVAGEDALLSALRNVAALPEPAYPEDDWEVLTSLLNVLPAAVEALKDVFAERGTVDFTEVAGAALASLGTESDPTDLMLSIDMALSHLLIDEYQDTSRTQLDLITALTAGWEPGDGRTLFIVGDPMQSIYLFREAEVGLFLQARTIGVGSVELAPLTLRSNFRSTPSIVEWVNSSFTNAFPAEEDVYKGSIRYELSVAVREEMDRLDSAGAVEVHYHLERDDEREAREAAALVRALAGRGTVAVLVRSRVHLSEITRVFKEEGIRFTSTNIDPLEETPVVKDLMSLLRALVHPFDRVAWLAVLRAPWCGLTNRDLHALAGGATESTVWDLLNDDTRLDTLTADGRARTQALVERLTPVIDLWGRVPPRRLIEGLWTSLGGPACLARASDLDDAAVFFDLLGTVTRAGRVESMDLLEEKTGKLYASSRGAGEEAVELLTMHGAKGLEFDHVILPGLGKTPGSESRELLIWYERGDDLLLAPVGNHYGGKGNRVYDYIRGVMKEKRELEKTRLLYVAATRARRGLHLFAHGSGDDEVFRADGRSLFSTIGTSAPAVAVPGPACEDEGSPANGGDDGNTGRPARADENLSLKRLVPGWSLPAPASKVVACSPTAAEPPGAGASVPEFEWAGMEVRHLGTVVHGCLCDIASEGLDKWSPERVRNERVRLSQSLKALGLNSADAKRVSAEAVDIVIKAIEDGRGRWVLGPHAEAEVEYPVTAVLDGRPVSVKIDRTFVDTDGVRWIIDYKTSRHRGGELREFLAAEKERYAPQLIRYADALRAGGEGRSIKMGLYYPAFATFLSWD